MMKKPARKVSRLMLMQLRGFSTAAAAKRSLSGREKTSGIRPKPVSLAKVSIPKGEP